MSSAAPFLLGNLSYLKTKVSCQFQLMHITEGTNNLYNRNKGTTSTLQHRQLKNAAVVLFQDALFITAKCYMFDLNKVETKE